MLRTIYDYYTHEFKEEDGIVVSYFQTKTGTAYRVYFYPAKDYFETLAYDSLIYNNGYYFGFTKVEPNESKKEPFDAKVMNTINNIINEFYDSEGVDSILIFHCSDDWGGDKKLKRANRFNLWFENAIGPYTFIKHNEEIIVHEFFGNDGLVLTDKEYLSLIFESTNQNQSIILDEFQQIKNKFTAGKG